MNDLPRASRVNANLKDRVLSVDDYPANNKAIMDIYGRQGIRFDLALDTPEALDYLIENSYDHI
jgi:PleD family two-component response regulator